VPPGLRSFGVTQAGHGDLGNPGGIAVGPGGRIYLAQPDFGLVSVTLPRWCRRSTSRSRAS